MYMFPEFLYEAIIAAKRGSDTKRRAIVGAVARRRDGKLVQSRNGSVCSPHAPAHAEARLMRKAGNGSIVAVARVLKNGEPAMAKPCPRCMAILRSKGVVCVTYTTGPDSYEMIAL